MCSSSHPVLAENFLSPRHNMQPELALPAAGERRARLTKTFAYYAAFIILGLAASVFGPTLQGISKNTGAGVDRLSYIFVVRSFGYLGGSLLAGPRYDRMKGHPLMAVSILVIAAC